MVKNVIKTIMLVLTTLCTVLALASCSEKEHQHSYVYESDATKHRQVCTECGEGTRWDAHVWGEWEVTKEATLDEKGSQEHTCTVCGYKGTEEIPMLKPTFGSTTDFTAFYAYVPADFETVNIYYWGENLDKSYVVGWPGVEMTLVNESEHLYGYTLPAGVDNVIINDGSSQTVDVAYSPDRNALRFDALNSDNKYEVIYTSYQAKADDPELPKPEPSDPVEMVTLYVVDTNGWDVLNIHYWGSKLGESEWPGVASTKVGEVEVNGESCNIYSVEVPEDATTYIANNKVTVDGVESGVQSQNIAAVADANCIVILADLSASYGNYKDGVFTAVEVDSGLPQFYIVGKFGTVNWTFEEANKLDIDEETMTATITVTLAVGDEFKIALNDWTREVSSDELGSAFSLADGGNIKVLTAGKYQIVVSNLDSTPSLTITAVTE